MGRLTTPCGCVDPSISVRNIPEAHRLKSITYGNVDLQKEPLRLDGPAFWDIVVRLAPKRLTWRQCERVDFVTTETQRVLCVSVVTKSTLLCKPFNGSTGRATEAVRPGSFQRHLTRGGLTQGIRSAILEITSVDSGI